MDHCLKREYTGKDESGNITPTCSCGWRDVGYGAYHNYQITMVRDQEHQHMRDVKASAIDNCEAGI